jgi:hypothetical protein
MTIAIGRDVGVNTIIGKPFIKGLQCVHDSGNNSVVAKLLNVAPFPVTEMFPQRYNNHEKLSDSVDPNFTTIISKLNALTAMLCPQKTASVPSLTIMTGYKPVKRVRFNDTPSQPVDPRPPLKASYPCPATPNPFLKVLDNIPNDIGSSAETVNHFQVDVVKSTVSDDASSVGSSLFGDTYEAVE